MAAIRSSGWHHNLLCLWTTWTRVDPPSPHLKVDELLRLLPDTLLGLAVVVVFLPIRGVVLRPLAEHQRGALPHSSRKQLIFAEAYLLVRKQSPPTPWYTIIYPHALFCANFRSFAFILIFCFPLPSTFLFLAFFFPHSPVPFSLPLIQFFPVGHQLGESGRVCNLQLKEYIPHYGSTFPRESKPSIWHTNGWGGGVTSSKKRTGYRAKGLRKNLLIFGSREKKWTAYETFIA